MSAMLNLKPKFMAAVFLTLSLSLLSNSLSQTKAEKGDQPKVPAGAAPVEIGKSPVGSVQDQVSGTALRVGDRVKISFFELLDLPAGGVQHDRSNAAKAPMMTFYQRMDLSGDYTIDGDGAVSFPRLGRFVVEGRMISDVQTALSAAFKQAMASNADVNVTVLESAPVYVIGRVRSSGAYKHVPGMTVLHALALAGGLDPQGSGSTSELIEGEREIERLRKATIQMARLLARRERLELERAGGVGGGQSTPAKIKASVTQSRIEALPASERSTLETEMSRRQRQLTEALANTQAVRNEIVALQRQMKQLDEYVLIRNERLNEMQKLLSRSLTTGSVVTTIRAELSDAEVRRQQMQVAIVQAESRLTQAENSRARLASDIDADLQRAIALTEAEIAELQPSQPLAEKMISILEERNAKILGGQSRALPSFEIVRRSQAGQIVIPAHEISSLLPGDVLKITVVPTAVPASENAPTPWRKASLGTTGSTTR